MPGKPDTKRAQHLGSDPPTDAVSLGNARRARRAALLEPLVASLPNATLHWLETADHGYRVLKRSRTRTDSVFDEMAEAARAFVDEQGGRVA